MSQSVDKLKELLFKPESEAIAALSTRIDAVFDRAGTKERFQSSVATVLDGALREAEVARHEEVSTAIAPLIVKTVKTEIRNSTDDLVEALYPATGRMVKAYVASAIKDLTDQINRRLETNPVMLGLNSVLSGRSAGELVIAQSQRLSVDDIFLIRRATGELVARFPEGTPGSNHDHVLGGVLTAINEFTTEAFKAEGSALRQIDLGESRVYLRVSPAYLLAARCTGSAHVAAEQILDDEFLALMDRHHAALDTDGNADATPELRNLSTKLETRLGELQPGGEALARGIKPLPILAALIGLPLLAWFAWGFYIDYRAGRVQGIAERVLASYTQMQGYPTELKVTRNGRVLLVSGLAPAEGVKSHVMGELRAMLPEVEVVDQLSAVPAGGPDVRPVIDALRRDQVAFEAGFKAEAAKRDTARAARALERTERLIARLLVETPEAASDLARLAKEARTLTTSLGGALKEPERAAIANRTRALAGELNALSLAGLADSGTAGVTEAAADTDATDGLAELAGRAANAAQAAVNLAAVRKRLAGETARIAEETARLRAQIAAIPAPTPAKPFTPREELDRFARSHAIFFTEQTAFRDEPATARLLDQLAQLMKRDSSLLRLVGFTDDAGTPAKNIALSQARADAVAAALIARGVPATRLVALRRASQEANISPIVGAGSANRRVELEVGFIGEGGE